MRSLTVHAIVRNATAAMAPGKARKMLESVADLMQAESIGGRILDFDDDASTSQIGPKCPNCSREPITISAHPVSFGPVPAMMFSCSGCRHVISVSVIPPMPMEAPQQRSSLLIS